MRAELLANTQGDYSTAIGEQATAAAPASVAIGYEAGVLDQSSDESVALGAYALAQAFHAQALGAYASAMVEGGTNISGIIFVRSGSRQKFWKSNPNFLRRSKLSSKASLRNKLRRLIR